MIAVECEECGSAYSMAMYRSRPSLMLVLKQPDSVDEDHFCCWKCLAKYARRICKINPNGTSLEPQFEGLSDDAWIPDEPKS